MNNTLSDVVRLVQQARAVVALTGAGISAESGVPTFRGAGGLWRTFRAGDLATPEAFARDPQLVWEWYCWRREKIAAARPNPGHVALAKLERRLSAFTLLTQNVDGLHREAGSRAIIELHGNLWRARCSAEPDRVIEDRGTRAPAEPPRCACGALLRPDVVWFGESLDPDNVERALAAVRACDVLLVIGTSAIVYPVAAFPSLARQAGARIVEINVADTPLTPQADVVIRGPAGSVLPELERAL